MTAFISRSFFKKTIHVVDLIYSRGRNSEFERFLCRFLDSGSICTWLGHLSFLLDGCWTDQNKISNQPIKILEVDIGVDLRLGFGRTFGQISKEEQFSLIRFLVYNKYRLHSLLQQMRKLVFRSNSPFL